MNLFMMSVWIFTTNNYNYNQFREWTVIYQWQTMALKINKNGKMYTKAPPPSYFAWRTPEEIPVKFNNKLCGSLFLLLLLFLLFLARMASLFIKNKMQ